MSSIENKTGPPEFINLNILVLSPHRDDAAFSLALAMDQWLYVGHKVTLLNIFTQSVYAPHLDTNHDNDRLAHVSTARKNEDAFFRQRLPGLDMTDLGLEDAPVRLHCDDVAVCDIAIQHDDTVFPEICKAIRQQLDADESFALVAPLGLGHHVDHCAVRDAALSFSANLPTAFYEDLPYATREGVSGDLARFRDEAFTCHHLLLHPVLVQGNHREPAAFKVQMAMLYASQIDQRLAETIAGFCQRYRGAERLWANGLWLEIADAFKLSTVPGDEASTLFPHAV